LSNGFEKGLAGTSSVFSVCSCEIFLNRREGRKRRGCRDGLSLSVLPFLKGIWNMISWEILCFLCSLLWDFSGIFLQEVTEETEGLARGGVHSISRMLEQWS
jgi:hypothetical protein